MADVFLILFVAFLCGYGWVSYGKSETAKRWRYKILDKIH